MRFLPSRIEGVVAIEPDPVRDERGFFERTWCAAEFGEHGLDARLAQCSASFNRRRGTLRGMHLQAPPHAEAKLVRVTRGAIHDVALDLRPDSPTFRQWVAEELSAENRRMLYVGPGLAHGFQTLEDQTEVFYQISVPHHPGSARGVRWDDPAFGIEWPLADPILNERDAGYPDFEDSPAPATRRR